MAALHNLHASPFVAARSEASPSVIQQPNSVHVPSPGPLPSPSHPIPGTRADAQVWECGADADDLVRVGIPSRRRAEAVPRVNPPGMELFPSTPNMGGSLLRCLHLLALVGSGWATLLSPEPGEVAAAEERVFTHGGAARDMASINMFKVYEKYSKEPRRQSHGNTVRSFKAVPSE